MLSLFKITGVFLVFLLSSLSPAWAGDEKPDVYEEAGNIFLKHDSITTQLTDIGKDSEPILSLDNNWLAFNREIESCSKNKWKCPRHQLWIINLKSRAIRKLLEPNVKSEDLTQVIGEFKNKIFSIDSQTLYFETWLGVRPGETRRGQSKSIHAISVNGENERFITFGGNPRIVKSGKEKNGPLKNLSGYLVVEMHKYFFAGGAFDIYRLVTPEGKVLWDFRESFEGLVEDFAMVLTENSPSAPTKEFETETIEKGSKTFSLLLNNLNLQYGANHIDLNSDGKKDVILKTYWDNGNAHSFTSYTIALNFGKVFYEIPLGTSSRYSISTSEGAGCGGSISYLRDFSFRLSEQGGLEIIEFRRKMKTNDTYGTSRKITITHYKLVDDRENIPGFPSDFLKPVKKYITRSKYCDVRELMR